MTAIETHWLTTNEASDLLRVSRDTLERHRVAWSDKAPRRGLYRYKILRSGSRQFPRYFTRDLNEALQNP